MYCSITAYGAFSLNYYYYALYITCTCMYVAFNAANDARCFFVCNCLGQKGDCTITISDNDFMDLVTGKIGAQKVSLNYSLAIYTVELAIPPGYLYNLGTHFWSQFFFLTNITLVNQVVPEVSGLHCTIDCHKAVCVSIISITSY